MKKIMIVFFICCFAMLFGCDLLEKDEYYSLVDREQCIDLPESLEKTIRREYKRTVYCTESYNDIAPCYWYYGTYNGAVVFHQAKWENASMTIVVDGIEFYKSTFFEIFAWKDHHFYAFSNENDAKQIVEDNILSREDLEQIKIIHDKKHNS